MLIQDNQALVTHTNSSVFPAGLTVADQPAGRTQKMLMQLHHMLPNIQHARIQKNYGILGDLGSNNMKASLQI